MILHYLSVSAELDLRTDYVNSEGFDYSNYNGYREYVMNTILGVIEARYKGGENLWMGALVFDTDEHLSWFLLRWS